ncbi:hypothetical protein QUA40_26270 [Microcoleus sp. Pol11C3]|uniref:hypothetical protein n=1 Tax=Microcoleus sp. Pol11C3 TaxID=3055390 RepID=UPI002FD6774E
MTPTGKQQARSFDRENLSRFAKLDAMEILLKLREPKVYGTNSQQFTLSIANRLAGSNKNSAGSKTRINGNRSGGIEEK